MIIEQTDSLTNHFYALIMAGGGGTRLWPLSRRKSPKQVLPLTEDRTMFQVTVDRLQDLFPPENIFVVTGRELVDPLHNIAPHIPLDNFVIEPNGRNSGPAAGLGTFRIARQDPKAVIAVLSADHYIAHEARFLDALWCANEYACAGHIVTLGIQPSYPATGFGYIKRGEMIESHGEFTVYKSHGFIEKPDEATATIFLQSGAYSWNAGMFVWQAAEALSEFERQQPEMYDILRRITTAPEYLDTIWDTIPSLSLDYAIMEGALNIAVIPVDIGWNDVGTWSTLFEVLNHDENGNAMRSKTNGHIQIDTHRTLIVSNRMVVTIGLENLVIVDTDDILLICNADRAHEVREVVQQLKEDGRIAHL